MKKLSLLIAGAVLLVFLTLLVSSAVHSNQGIAVAHHMAPVDNNVTNGNLNEEMVHFGVDISNDTGAPENGTLHWSNPWTDDEE